MASTALKSTNQEILDRIEFTAQLMGSGAPDYAVKQKVRQEYGVSRATCLRYMSRARGLMIAWTERPKQDHFVDSYNHYRTIIQTTSDPVAKLRAQERIDSLFGLDAKYTGGTTNNTQFNVILEQGQAITEQGRMDQVMALLDRVGERIHRDEAGAAPHEVHPAPANGKANGVPSP